MLLEWSQIVTVLNFMLVVGIAVSGYFALRSGKGKAEQTISQNTIAALQAEITVLHSKIARLEGDIDFLEAEVKRLEREVKKLTAASP